MRTAKTAPLLALVVVVVVVSLWAGGASRDSTTSKMPTASPIDIGSELHLPTNFSESASRVVVALLDTPIDPGVRALQGQILGVEEVLDSRKAQPASTVHGTEMASLIAALPQTGSPVRGVAHNAAILSIPIVDQSVAEPSAIVSGLREAVRAQAEVIVLPYGSSTWPSEVQSALRKAVAQGAIPVLSAGNRGGQSSIPSIAGTIVAASLNIPNGTLEPYSGPATINGFVLPGGEASPSGHRVAVLGPGNRSALAAGSSVSTALLAGTAALLKGAVPSAQPAEVVGCLEETAEDMGPTGPDIVFGYGIPHVTAAIECLRLNGGST